jgi:hypothetical protein
MNEMKLNNSGLNAQRFEDAKRLKLMALVPVPILFGTNIAIALNTINTILTGAAGRHCA